MVLHAAKKEPRKAALRGRRFENKPKSLVSISAPSGNRHQTSFYRPVLYRFPLLALSLCVLGKKESYVSYVSVQVVGRPVVSCWDPPGSKVRHAILPLRIGSLRLKGGEVNANSETQMGTPKPTE